MYEFLITSTSIAGLIGMNSALNESFTMTNLGFLRNFIGLDVNQKASRIMITHYRYIGDLLKRFHMTDCKEAPFPFLSGIRLEEGSSVDVYVTLECIHLYFLCIVT